MGLAAQLYEHARAERHALERDATLRDPEWAPLDVVVEDLSEGGFRMATGADLTIGDEIGIGLAGLGTRQARIVRSGEDHYGCVFAAALTVDELAAALHATPVAPITLPRETAPPAPWADAAPLEDMTGARWPVRQRLAVMAAGAALTWPAAIALIRLARHLFTA